MPWRSITSRGRYCVVSVTTATRDIGGGAYPSPRTSANAPGMSNAGSSGRRRVDERRRKGGCHEVPRADLQRRVAATRTRRPSRTSPRSSRRTASSARPRARPACSSGGEGLQPTATATTVRVRDGERMLTDGPFAETKEQLGGYYLLECKDLDEALDVGRADPRGHRRARSRCARSWTTRRSRRRRSRLRGRRLTHRRTSSSTACSGASRGRRSRSSPASSATSTAPRRRCRTRS